MTGEELTDRAKAVARLTWKGVLLAIVSLALAWQLLWVANDQTAGSSEQALLHFIVGALLTTAGAAIKDLFTRGEAYQQGAYTERAKAVRELLDWTREAREGFKFLFPPSANPWSNVDSQLLTVRNEAFSRDVWIGKSGVDAVRDLIEGVRTIDRTKITTQDEAVAAFNVHFDRLTRRLMGDLGYWPR
jgi:hypothetical protein